MKKISIIGSFMLLAAASYLYISPSDAELRETNRAEYADFISNHPYSTRDHMTKKELKKIPKKDRPDLAAELDFLLTMDPELKRPAPERIADFLKKKAQDKIGNQNKMAQQPPGSETFPWIERGPNNVGGRTRAIMFDPNDSTYSKVWAGGVTGGLWYNNNIYNSNSEWQGVSQLWENIPISSICSDPQDPQIFYAGTGEGFGGRSGVGAGIWKTTDAGTTWDLLPTTVDYKIINDLIMRQEGDTSVLYIASDRMSGYQGSGSSSSFGIRGLFKSTDGGDTFTEIEYNNNSITSPSDLELGTDNTLWVATVSESGRIFSLSDTLNATLDYVNSGIFLGDRVEIATAPSDSNYLYAIVEANSKVSGIFRTTDHGSTWDTLTEPIDSDGGIDNDDFSRGQAWYDLIIQVDPNDKETVLTGAINVFKSVNGGTTWQKQSQWWGPGAGGFPYIHADQHNIIFKPGSSDTVLFANDGGVFLTKSMTSAGTVITDANKEYNVTQFYACDISPTSGQNLYLAGAQDNGTQLFQSAGMNSTTEAYGGDGGYCFIDKLDSDYRIVSYVYNNYYLSEGSGYDPFLNEETGGYFINPAGYDSNVGTLYATRNTGNIYRAQIGYTDYISISGMGKATHFSISDYSDEDSSTVFIGTVTGQIFKLENAAEADFTYTNITASAMPNGSVSCIAIGSSEDELLATFSNYGVNSVWYTNNGGDTWTNVEGDLPDMPVRWALFNPANWGEVILATELGVWTTPNIQFPSVAWTQSINGMENVRVNMLRLRQSDYQVVAATFGRGLFTSDGFAEAYEPIAIAIATDTTLCVGKQTELKDISSYLVDDREWKITPSSGYEYMNGTDSSSQYPTLKFNDEGNYTVQLIVQNSNGADTVTKINYIKVLDMVGEVIYDAVHNKLIASVEGDSYQWLKSSAIIPGATSQEYIPTQNGSYRVEVEKDGFCKKRSPSFSLENVNLDENSLNSLDLWYSKDQGNLIISTSEDYNFSTSELFIADTQGRKVYNEKITNTEISTADLSPGIYIAIITDNGKQTAQAKFVIQ